VPCGKQPIREGFITAADHRAPGSGPPGPSPPRQAPAPVTKTNTAAPTARPARTTTDSGAALARTPPTTNAANKLPRSR